MEHWSYDAVMMPCVHDVHMTSYTQVYHNFTLSQFSPDLKCTLRSSGLILKNCRESSGFILEFFTRIVCFSMSKIEKIGSSVLAQKDRLLWSLRSSASGRIVYNGLYRSHHWLINKRKIYGPYNMVLSLKI